MRADRTTAVVGAVAINAVLIGALLALSGRTPPPPSPHLVEITTVAPVAPARVPAPAVTAPGGAAPGGSGHKSAPRAARSRRTITRADELKVEPGEVTGIDDGGGLGLGLGLGLGNGNGNGIGLGDGGGVRAIADLPTPPPPPVSKARPAKLLHPTRQTEVEEAELFAAIVTVDTDGDVVGARMTRSHPGTRGDTASSMIWQFRYAPALDFDGEPIKSTFVQTFAVR